MTQAALRRATLSDCAALTDICFRAKQSNGYDEAFMAACRAELTVTADTLATNEVWLAAQGQTPCGCVALCQTETPGTGEVSLFFVAPEAQKQGIGQTLWTHVRQQAKSQGTHRLILHADPKAVPFYEKIGFQTVAQAPSASIPGRMLPVMEQSL